jgi:hypothetical protein
MKRKIFGFFLVFVSATIFGQSFEGTVTYKIISINPYTQISDSVWHERLKEYYSPKGYSLQKYFYKGNKYMSETDFHKTVKFQVYNPKNGLLYNWVDKSDTVVTINSKINRDELFEIIDLNKTETIMNIQCKGLIFKTRQNIMTVWYNPLYLKVDASLYKGHIFGSWEQILKRTGCLPIRIENTGEIGKVVKEIVEYKEMSVDDNKFNIPEFEVALESNIDFYVNKH